MMLPSKSHQRLKMAMLMRKKRLTMPSMKKIMVRRSNQLYQM